MTAEEQIEQLSARLKQTLEQLRVTQEELRKAQERLAKLEQRNTPTSSFVKANGRSQRRKKRSRAKSARPNTT